ncbi:unnamed protein product [Adineta steineri]|uniref:RNase III domain-containing protein n=1 Tax=Adineta steineri TaxID=433720 RepID=A0A815NMC6_9BILA|nr:unnamed protein product [Adineta steineri]CAF3998535.1 unnamed protein product [Adineta steineri]
MPRQWIDIKSRSTLEDVLGYKFKNPDLLWQALTHSSAISENHPKAFARDLRPLEFVGDSALLYAAARYLFLNGSDDVVTSSCKLHAGTQTAIKNSDLAKIARERLHLEEYLIRGNGHRDVNETLYSDCLEAILGAIALDCGNNQQEIFFRIIEKICSDRYEHYVDKRLTNINRMLSSKGGDDESDIDYTIDWPKTELQTALRNHNSIQSTHYTNYWSTLSQCCLWIFAVFGFCILLFVYMLSFSQTGIKRFGDDL